MSLGRKNQGGKVQFNISFSLAVHTWGREVNDAVNWLRKYGFYVFLPVCLLCLGLGATRWRQGRASRDAPVAVRLTAGSASGQALCDPLDPSRSFDPPHDLPVTLTALGQWQAHDGFDLPAPEGTPVHALHDGRVTAMEAAFALGNRLLLEGEAFVTEYACLAGESPCRVGQWVRAGQVLGAVGPPGWEEAREAHLHLRITAQPPQSR